MIDELLRNKSGIQLDLGCGRNKQPDFLGMDRLELPGVDIVHDVEDVPWPLPDESVVRLLASHLLEHINPASGGFLAFMDEAWRVCKPGAQFLISMPHGRSDGYIQDPTHCNPCNEVTFLYFDPLNDRSGSVLWDFYRPKPWRILNLTWDPSANMEIVLAKRSIDELGVLNGNG